MVWAGLRGAVGLAMAIMVESAKGEHQVAPELRSRILDSLTSGTLEEVRNLRNPLIRLDGVSTCISVKSDPDALNLISIFLIHSSSTHIQSEIFTSQVSPSTFPESR
jgi:hypothetical protein